MHSPLVGKIECAPSGKSVEEETDFTSAKV